MIIEYFSATDHFFVTVNAAAPFCYQDKRCGEGESKALGDVICRFLRGNPHLLEVTLSFCARLRHEGKEIPKSARRNFSVSAALPKLPGLYITIDFRVGTEEITVLGIGLSTEWVRSRPGKLGMQPFEK